MSILVIADHNNTRLSGDTLNTIAAARKISLKQNRVKIHVLVAGLGCKGVAEAMAKVAAVDRILLADLPAYAHQLPENLAPLIAQLSRGYSHVLAPANAHGKNVLPRVAALLDVDQISEIIKVNDADTFQPAIYSGQAIATVQSCAPIKVMTIHTASFAPVACKGGRARIDYIGASCNTGLSRVIADAPTATEIEAKAQLRLLDHATGLRAKGTRPVVRLHRRPTTLSSDCYSNPTYQRLHLQSG